MSNVNVSEIYFLLELFSVQGDSNRIFFQDLIFENVNNTFDGGFVQLYGDNSLFISQKLILNDFLVNNLIFCSYSCYIEIKNATLLLEYINTMIFSVALTTFVIDNSAIILKKKSLNMISQILFRLEESNSMLITRSYFAGISNCILAFQYNQIIIMDSFIFNDNPFQEKGFIYLENENKIVVTRTIVNGTFSVRGIGDFLFLDQNNQANLTKNFFLFNLENNFANRYLFYIWLNFKNNIRFEENELHLKTEASFINVVDYNYIEMHRSVLKTGISFSSWLIQINNAEFVGEDINFVESNCFLFQSLNSTIKLNNLFFRSFSSLIVSISSQIFIKNSKFVNPKKIQNSVFNLENSIIELNSSSIEFINFKNTDAFLQLTDSDLFLSKNTFFGNKLEDGSALIKVVILENKLKSNKFMFILNKFTFNYAYINSSIFYFSYINPIQNYSLTDQIIMHRNKIIRNRGLYGNFIRTPIFLNYSLTLNSFEYNKAFLNYKQAEKLNSKGGVFYLNNVDDCITFPSLILLNNTFLQNQADYGGVFFFNSSKPLSSFQLNFLQLISSPTSNYYIFNRASSYGPIYATKPKAFFFESESSYRGEVGKGSTYDIGIDKSNKKEEWKGGSFDILSHITSGIEVGNCLTTIFGRDFAGNEINLYDESFEDLFLIEFLSAKTTLKFRFERKQQVLCLNKVISQTALPLTEIFLISLTYKGLEGFKKVGVGEEEKERLTLRMEFNLQCELGQNIYENGTCYMCPREYYLFEKTDVAQTFAHQFCIKCTEEIPFYCFGGLSLTPKRGYWRFNENSTNFIKCPIDQVCLGDTRIQSSDYFSYFNYDSKYATGKCQENHEGVFCLECAKGYGRVGNQNCEQCNSYNYILTNVIKFIFKCLLLLFALTNAVNGNISVARDMDEGKIKIFSTNLMKIFIDYIQIFSMIAFLPIDIPTNLTKFNEGN